MDGTTWSKFYVRFFHKVIGGEYYGVVFNLLCVRIRNICSLDRNKKNRGEM